MTDLHERFGLLDNIETEDLWHEIELRYEDDVERVIRHAERPRRRFAVAAAAAFLLAILLGAAILMARFQEEEPPIITQVPTPTSLPSPTSTLPEVPTARLADVLEWSLLTFPGEVEVDCESVEGVGGQPCDKPFGAVLNDVVVANGELVAVGHDGSTGNWEGVFLTSSDGATWNRLPDTDHVLGGPGDQDIWAFAAGDDAVVAVGSTDCAAHGITTPLRRCPAIWTSEAGNDWERVGIDAIRTEDGTRFESALAEEPFAPDLSFLPDGYEMRSVAWTGEQFVAVGEAIWTSPDGRSWTMHSLPSGESGECTPECQANSVVATGNLIIAVGRDPTLRASPQGGKASVWESHDGQHWSQTQLDLPPYSELKSVAASGDGVVTVSSANIARGAMLTGIENVQKMNWSEPEDLEPYFDIESGALITNDVIVDGQRVILVGYRDASVDLFPWSGAARILASLDGGTTWEQYPTTPYSLFGNSSTAINAATVFDDRIIVVGLFNTDAAVWTGTWTG